MKAKSPLLRRPYLIHFAFRLCVLGFVVAMYFLAPESFGVLVDGRFFQSFGWLHILWIIWVIDMIRQLIPTKGYLPLGSLKQFRNFYKPIKTLVERAELLPFIRKNGMDFLKVLGVWTLLVAGIGVLWWMDILREKELLLLSVVFFVLDLTFVLFWCPFRVWILKNRCCTTCRIFNWDHMMMFSPIMFIPSFYSISLFGLSMIKFLIWECCFILYPERFCEETNAALHCQNCTDKLCRSAGQRASYH